MATQQGPRTEFSQALKALATERGLDIDVIIETIKQAYIAAYKKDAKELGIDVESFEYDAPMDSVTGEAKIIAWPIDNPEDKKDVTPPGFGRIAAQTAKQVIHQKIREAEKGVVMTEFEERVGSLISGIILRFEGGNVRVDLGKTEAIMLAEDRVPQERLNSGQRLTFLLKAIEDTPRGKQLMLSRADKDFVLKVFAREVPEIASGSVEIKVIARDPGVRTKIAVFSTQSGVDPVGSCVGQKGVRVQAVTNELGGERVDIIPWTENEEDFIKAALAPVEIISVKLNKKEKMAVVTVSESDLSVAIGKEGQNVRLASILTDWKIEVEGIRTEKDEARELEASQKEETVSVDEPSVENSKAEEVSVEEVSETQETETQETETQETETQETETQSDS